MGGKIKEHYKTFERRFDRYFVNLRMVTLLFILTMVYAWCLV